MYCYEGLFLISSKHATSNWDDCRKEVLDMITRHGGEVVEDRNWGERKLAYEIGRHRRGTYQLVYFKAPGDTIPKVERDVTISDVLLRCLVLRIPDKHFDLLRESVPELTTDDMRDRPYAPRPTATAEKDKEAAEKVSSTASGELSVDTAAPQPATVTDDNDTEAKEPASAEPAVDAQALPPETVADDAAVEADVAPAEEVAATAEEETNQAAEENVGSAEENGN